MGKQEYTVISNEKQMQFEIHTGGETAMLQYRFYKEAIALMHTVVPDNLSGQGIASTLAKYALDWTKVQHKKALVYCSFVAAFVKRHPEYNEVVNRQ